MELIGIGIGMGMICIGSAYGIGKLAVAAAESTARQPEAGGAIRTTSIILAALIEGFTFFALIIAMNGVDNVAKANAAKASAPTTVSAPAAPH